MLKAMIRILVTSLIIMSHQNIALAGDSTTPATGATDQVIIDGVTNFLADRAQANAAYIYQNQLKNNKALACYLPNTHTALLDAELISLIKTNSGIWRDRLADDIIYTSLRLLLNKYEDILTKLDDNNLADNFAKNIANNLKMQIWNENFNNKNKFVGSEIDELVNSRTKEIAEGMARASLRVSESANKKPKYKLKDSTTGIESETDCFVITDLQLTAIAKALDNMSKALAATKPTKDANWEELKNAKLANLYFEITSLFNSIHNNNYSTAAMKLIALVCSGDGNTVGCMNRVAAASDDDSERAGNGNRKLTSQILFFAALADAKTSDKVTTILQNFMMPPVSFGEIRERTHLSIASYVGVYGTSDSEQKQTPNSRGTLGMYAPIGLQKSWPCPDSKLSWNPKSWVVNTLPCSVGGSVGLMLSPFDFGYPLSLKLNGSNNAVTLRDVVNLSIALSFGLKDEPINWGVAWQRVQINQLNANSGSRFLMFYSFDMPLYIIH